MKGSYWWLESKSRICYQLPFIACEASQFVQEQQKLKELEAELANQLEAIRNRNKTELERIQSEFVKQKREMEHQHQKQVIDWMSSFNQLRSVFFCTRLKLTTMLTMES